MSSAERMRRPGLAAIAAVAATVAVALVMGLSACTADASPPPSAATELVRPGAPGGGTATATPAHPEASQSDADFVQNMVAHHAQGVELAELAAERASDDEVRAIADRIAEVQSAELAYLTSWLDRHGVASDGHGHDAATMPGLLSATTMERARSLTGTEFDQLFLDAMSTHHRGAVAMAEELLAAGGDGAVTTFARGVAEGQSIEVDRMQEALARLQASG